MILVRSLLALLLMAALAHAQQAQTSGYLALDYDLDSATFVYPRLTGANGTPWGGPIGGPNRVKTAGSSTTISAETAGNAPFRDVAVNDVLVITIGNAVNVRVVLTHPDNDTVTVNTVIDIVTPVGFGYFKSGTGTGADAGWFDVSGNYSISVSPQYDAGDLAGGLDLRVECMPQGINAQPQQAYPDNSAGATNRNFPTASVGYEARATFSVIVAEASLARCRVGIKAGTSDADGTIERISILLGAVQR